MSLKSPRRCGFVSQCILTIVALLLLLPSGGTVRAEEKKPSTPVLPFVEGSWSLVLLPDTQHYSEKYPGLFDAQTVWIERNREKHRIQYVFQLGDITNNGKPQQWKHARESMRLLDGKVPYALALGNHDYRSLLHGTDTRTTAFNEFFSPEEFKKWPTFGGLMNDSELQNSYHLFRAGDRDWIVLALEWAPRNETIAWAEDVLKKYPSRSAILITHSYLFSDGTRLNFASKGKSQHDNPHAYRTPGSMNDGEELWNKLVKKYPFAFVFSGHIATEGARQESKNDREMTTHEILSDFQDRQLGGEAYLNLVEFLPDGKTVQFKTYSPLYDSYLTGPKQQYKLLLDEKR